MQVLKSHRVREVRVRIVDGLAHDKPRKLTSPRAGRKAAAVEAHVNTPLFSPYFTSKLPELPTSDLFLFVLFGAVSQVYNKSFILSPICG